MAVAMLTTRDISTIIKASLTYTHTPARHWCAFYFVFIYVLLFKLNDVVVFAKPPQAPTEERIHQGGVLVLQGGSLHPALRF